MVEIVCLTEALDRYKSKVSFYKKGYLQELYRINLICKSFLASKNVHEITSIDIAKYRDDRLSTCNIKTNKAISPATVRLELALLSNFFDISRIEWGYCEDNPVKNVRKPTPPPGRNRRLTPREEKLILSYANSHNNKELYSIIIIALETAMRQSEIINLKWENINLKNRIAHLEITKNGSFRDVPLSLKARDALIRIGTSTKGNVFFYKSSGIKSTWRFMMKKLSIEDLHFHDLRHEAVSRLFELGTLDMMEISAISGHKSLSMLKRYTHLKAQKLVAKLEGNKNKGRAAILSAMIPYPASITNKDTNCFEIRILDFNDLKVTASSKEECLLLARDALMRRIIELIKLGTSIPQPDQYLENVEKESLVTIDPLDGF